jgi:hypothetical protein
LRRRRSCRGEVDRHDFECILNLDYIHNDDTISCQLWV